MKCDKIGDDGLHKPDWLRDTFKDLQEDFAEAQAEGKRLLILVEQRGCSYCRSMHENTFTVPLAIAVQEGNYIGMTGADVDPGMPIEEARRDGVTNVPLLHAFAKEFLKVNYIFWQDEEPYFRRDVLAHLK